MSLKVTDFSYSLKKQHHKTILRIIAFAVSVYFVISIVIAFLLFPVRQISTSMKPEINENSFILTTPLDKSPKRGDIYLLKPHAETEISFTKKVASNICAFFTAQQIQLQQNENLPCSKNQLRRVVGMPGDTIYMRDYIVYVCPQNEKHYLTEFELSEKKYTINFYAPPANWDTNLGVIGNFEKITLGENEYFVLGDNRKSCDDSRLWGIITSADFASKALLCYFPFNSLKLL